MTSDFLRDEDYLLMKKDYIQTALCGEKANALLVLDRVYSV